MDIEYAVLKLLFSNILPLRRGVERVFILVCHVNAASDMWNLGFKGLLHILMNPIIIYIFFCFRLTLHLLVT